VADVPHVSIADIRMRRVLNHEPPAIRDISRKIPRSVCYTTGMFALSNPYAYVTSAAFAQAQLRPGSDLLRSAHVYSPRRGIAKAHLTRNHQLLPRGPKRSLS
jgi:hypothetical protein